jgi:PAS domain S-box-containing protein
LGWSEQELLSRPFLEFVHPDDLEPTRRVIGEELQAGKRVISFQNRYRCKDGSYRWLDWNSHPIVEEGLTFAIAHDITDRVQVEAALRESEHRFRSFVENANDIVYAVDFDGVFTYVSPNWLELMGEPASEAVGKSFRPYVHPDDVHLCEEFLARVLREGRRERSVEYRVRTADGRLRWHVSSGSPLRNDAGEVVSYMGIARDTTEVKRVQQAMRESETRYRTLAENFPDGALFLIDRAFRYLAADGRALETAGLADEQIVGRTVEEVFPDLWPEMREHHEAVFRGQEVYYEIEFGGRLYSNQSLPVRDEQGNVVRAIVVTQDITDKKQAERDREQLQAQLMQSQKLEAVGRLAGGVAHDFNNKLQTILGCADMLLSDAADAETDAETGEYLRIIRDSARQSADLTRQLLAFARKQTISPKVLDLNKTIAGMLKMLRRLIGEDIELSWLPAGEVCNVRMDPVQVDQILANLVVNARDAITGVGRITIETGSAEFDEDYCRDHADFLPGRYAMLAVSDDGAGMDEETVQRAFEPFYTTKSQDQGTGLGLATVYGILRQNEGFVNIYSEPGRGSTFRIYLPCVSSAPPAEAEQAPAGASVSEGRTILLVEDEASLLKLNKRLLEHLGYTVLSASDPEEAMGIVRQRGGEIDLMMTDVIMPRMSGRELWDQVRPMCPEMRCLFTSGYTANVIAHHNVLDEGVHFLQKPFTAADLKEKIGEVLESPVE